MKKTASKKTLKNKAKPSVLNITPRAFVDECNKRDDGFVGGMLEGINLGGEMGGLAAMLGIESLIQQEERILMLEPDHEELPNEIQRYVEMRKKIKAALGQKFEEIYQQARKTHNECACANLISSKGTIYSYVLPKFNDDGSHEPLGSRDFPWNQKKERTRDRR